MEQLRKLIEDYNIHFDEWVKLATIGGHSVYHLEGNALQHTLLVFEESMIMFRGNWEMQRCALLHDIGKIYTSIEIAPGDWQYPDHSTCGGFKGILAKFIPLNDPHFCDYQWLIRNHIKPLYWRNKGVNADKPAPWEHLDESLANMDNLRKLAICDLIGSKPVNQKDTDDNIAYLKSLTL